MTKRSDRLSLFSPSVRNNSIISQSIHDKILHAFKFKAPKNIDLNKVTEISNFMFHGAWVHSWKLISTTF
jgi:hypothetical protein